MKKILKKSGFLFCRSPAEHYALQQDEEAQHASGRDALPPGIVQTAGYNDLLDRGQRHYAEKGAGHIAHAAGQQRSADNGGSDRVHFHARRVSRIACAGMHHENIARDTA